MCSSYPPPIKEKSELAFANDYTYSICWAAEADILLDGVIPSLGFCVLQLFVDL